MSGFLRQSPVTLFLKYLALV